MQCKEMLGSLSDYIDGELESALCEAIERHMAGCGNCRTVVDTMRRTVRLYRVHGHAELPEDVRARLYAVIKLLPETHTDT